jgi:hypothetical protein
VSSKNDAIVNDYRELIRTGVGKVFDKVRYVRPRWEEDDVRNEESDATPRSEVTLRATLESGFRAETKTARDGSYEFGGLPPGSYTITPTIGEQFDFDHEYEEHYKPSLSAGQCASVNFLLEPITRIKGHVIFPAKFKAKTIKVVAIPTNLKKLNQFSGKSDFTGEGDEFDLWPLPPGDYYVGVNINSSPKEDSPFPPTYYPGETTQRKAKVVHIREGEVRKLELRLPEIAKTRAVYFVAIGLDGKPMRKIYVQLEDLRHPGDASSYVNVDLDENGAGTLNVYAGYPYHLHGSHWVSYGNDWCSKPVDIPAGNEAVETRFVMDHSAGNCQIDEIDGLKR